MTFYNNPITEIEIENSSICNAACPACAREQEPGKYNWFKEQYISTDFFKDRIPVEVYKNLKRILFTGTIGDPCTAPNFIEVVSTVRQLAPHVKISVATNGGMKTANWWAKLAVALGENSDITFAIDGLADTNDIYRVNVKWNNVINNVKSFINAGGNACWQYIVFEHNQHQVDAAKELAQHLGFKSFMIKPSHRFKVDEFLGVEHRYGKNNIVIQPPSDERYIHKVMIVKKEDYVRPGSDQWFENSKNTKINCFVKENNMVYIDYLGRMLPCCFLSGGIFVRRGNHWPDGWDELWETHGNDHVNLHLHDWNNVINSNFFKGVESSWSNDYTNGRIITCAGTCSEFNGRLNDAEEFCKYETINF
jgi:MoaA/NifB/PqqE/SkfB family radical SAM enzyme